MSCGTDIKVVEQSNNPLEGLEFRGVGDIKVTPTYEPGKKVITIELDQYSPPIIQAEANPVREVGATVGFIWNVEIIPGREAVVSRTITPAPNPVPNMNLPFVVTVSNKKVTSRQTPVYHTIEVTDSLNEIIQRVLAISFVNKVYLLYSYKDGVSAGQLITQADIALATGTVVDNIKTAYSGLRTYNIPSVGALQYIYWIYETGTVPINSMKLSGLPFPLLFIPGSISVTNANDGTISANYSLVRSVNKFGNGPISLDML